MTPPENAATVAPLTLRYMAGKCICSNGDHGHDRWLCPGDAIKVPTSPHAHRCVACWGRVPSETGWPA